MLRIYSTEQKGFFRTTQVNWRYLNATNMPFFDIFKGIQAGAPCYVRISPIHPAVDGVGRGGSSDQTVQLFDNALCNIYDL